ncbi:hypothetical protein FHS96_005645 [Sphingomonas zeicaulis]|uniref:hypothetical protein n=1 Tax=Sphingomonas zeicaulis TaxID=1632740 RepID=UPI003D1B0673
MPISEFNEKLLQSPTRPLRAREVAEIASVLVTLENCDSFIFGRRAIMHLAGDERGAEMWGSLAFAVEAIRNAPRV